MLSSMLSMSPFSAASVIEVTTIFSSKKTMARTAEDINKKVAESGTTELRPDKMMGTKRAAIILLITVALIACASAQPPPQGGGRPPPGPPQKPVAQQPNKVSRESRGEGWRCGGGRDNSPDYNALMVHDLTRTSTSTSTPQDKPPPGANPPPLKENKQPGDSRQGPPKVDRNGTKADGRYIMSSGGFNIEVNGGNLSPASAHERPTKDFPDVDEVVL